MTSAAIVEARRLRNSYNMSCRRIAEILGVSTTTVYRWLNEDYADRSRQQAREAKRRRVGKCEDCGGETRYNGHTATGSSRFCVACAAIRNGANQKVWTRDRIIAAIQWWADVYGKQPAIADFNPTLATALGDYRRAERAERHTQAGEIPWFSTVVLEFGTWSAGIAAAGFTPLPNHGGGVNVSRRRRVLA